MSSKSDAAAWKRAERERKRAAGLVLRQLWVHPSRLDEYERARKRLETPRRARETADAQ